MTHGKIRNPAVADAQDMPVDSFDATKATETFEIGCAATLQLDLVVFGDPGGTGGSIEGERFVTAFGAVPRKPGNRALSGAVCVDVEVAPHASFVVPQRYKAMMFSQRLREK